MGGRKRRLTNKQIVVVGLIASGMTNKEIAEILQNAESTISTIRSQCLERMDAINTANLIYKCIQFDLIECPCVHT